MKVEGKVTPVKQSFIVLSKKSIIERIDMIVEDNNYRLKHTRLPSKKRNLKDSIEFFSAIKHHLTDKPHA